MTRSLWASRSSSSTGSSTANTFSPRSHIVHRVTKEHPPLCPLGYPSPVPSSGPDEARSRRSSRATRFASWGSRIRRAMARK